MFKFYSSSQIRAIRRVLYEDQVLSGYFGASWGVLFEATHQRPHMVLDTQENPPPETTLSVYL